MELTSGAIGFNPMTGTLTAPAADIRSLVSGRPSSDLMEANAVDPGGTPHPALRDTVDAMRNPHNGVARLIYKQRAMEVWRGQRAVAVLMPAGGNRRHRLVRVPLSSLSGAILRAVGLRDRPAPPDGPRPASRLARDPAVLRWWWLACGPAGAGGGAVLEVVDATEGLFVISDGMAMPSASSSVVRLVAAAVDGGPVVTPLRPILTRVGLPTACPHPGDGGGSVDEFQ